MRRLQCGQVLRMLEVRVCTKGEKMSELIPIIEKLLNIGIAGFLLIACIFLIIFGVALVISISVFKRIVEADRPIYKRRW